MVTNPYFNNFNHVGEQTLIEDLIVESIKMYGIDVYYVPRTIVSENKIFNEDDMSTFDSAHIVEMYIKNIDGFEGDGDFLSNLGLQIRDSITFTVAQKSFNENVAAPAEIPRPNEGDYIYFPLTSKMYEIQHVEHEAIFYQAGKLQTYDLRAELVEYSHEQSSTGIPVIDDMYSDIDISGIDTLEELELVDDIADNKEIQDEADNIVDWSESNPFGGNF